jgi:flagellar protein FlbD
MIKLTRLSGEVFILNADLIQYVERRPDTFVTLTSGERLVVSESMDEVLRRAVVYQQAKHLLPPPSDGLHKTTPAPSRETTDEPSCRTSGPVIESAKEQTAACIRRSL